MSEERKVPRAQMEKEGKIHWSKIKKSAPLEGAEIILTMQRRKVSS